MEIVNIMKDVGFGWGGDFKSNPDAMHFELKTMDTSVLKSGVAQRYAAILLPDIPFKQAQERIQNPEALSVSQSKSLQNQKEKAVSGSEILRANREKYTPLFAKYEDKYALPPGILMKIFTKETGALENAERAASKVGAGGLMQLMPKVARKFGADLGYTVQTYPIVEVGQYKNGQKKYELDPRDSRNNVEMVIDISATLVRYLCKKYGNDVVKVMQAYNWGEGNLDHWLKTGVGINGKPMPAETVKYTQNI